MFNNLKSSPQQVAPALPNGLRPEFDVWSVGQSKVFAVKWLGDGYYSITGTDGTILRTSTGTLLNNLHAGFFVTLQVNHDQK